MLAYGMAAREIEGKYVGGRVANGVGSILGNALGLKDGAHEEKELGNTLGLADGEQDGRNEGDTLGEVLGTTDGEQVNIVHPHLRMGGFK